MHNGPCRPALSILRSNRSIKEPKQSKIHSRRNSSFVRPFLMQVGRLIPYGQIRIVSNQCISSNPFLSEAQYHLQEGLLEQVFLLKMYFAATCIRSAWLTCLIHREMKLQHLLTIQPSYTPTRITISQLKAYNKLLKPSIHGRSVGIFSS